MILHLIRHSEPDIAPGTCYGQLDISAKNLSATAARLRPQLPVGVPLWSSPLQRCRALAQLLDGQFASDQRLAEINFGAWEGQLWDAIPRAELDAWAADIAGYAPPGGESPRALQTRALAFVASLSVPEAIIVTHAGVIRCLMAHWQALPPAQWSDLVLAYGSHTRVEIAP